MKLVPLAIAATLLSQAAPRPAPDALRFNWPKDLTARVETEKTRERSTGTTTTTTNKYSYRMRALPHPDGLVVRYDEFKFDGAAAPEVAAFAEMLASIVPNLVVDPEGAFLRVEDITPLRNTVTELLRRGLKGEELPPKMADLVSRLTSEEVLSSLAGQEWQQLVGVWQDLPISSEKFEVDVEEPSPVWPDVKIPMKVSGGMVEKSTCTRNGTARACAVFETRSAVDQPTAQALMQRMLEGAKNMPAVRFETFDVVTVVRVKLETETMVPHTLTSTKTVQVSATPAGEGRQEIKQVDRRTSRFEY